MNYLDLLPDDLIEKINKHLIESDINERRKARKRRKKIQKEKKRNAKHYKICEKLLEKCYCKYNNISDFEFCVGGEIPCIKINYVDSRFNEFVTIIVSDNFIF
jgi:hypothetical protein